MKTCKNNNNEDRCNSWCHNGYYCHATDEQLTTDCHVYKPGYNCQTCQHMRRCADFLTDDEDEPEVDSFARFTEEIERRITKNEGNKI